MNFLKRPTAFVVFLVALTLTKSYEYSRAELQEMYPGFGTDYVLFPDEDKNDIIGYFKMENGTRLFSIGSKNIADDVKFQFFSREHLNGVPINSKEDLKNYVDKNKPTKFITHGWMSGGDKDTCVLIKNGFLHKYDSNIFIIDWSAISGNPFYPVPMAATPDVAKYYGTYLNYLIDNVGVHPDNIHLVGHSLGAHVSGFAAREVKNGKIGRVTGLDPALPGFDVGLVPLGTLRNSDANFVDVIHTCAGYLGYKQPLGHVDFYPNGGGPPQPGCSILKFMEACSHGRSWKIFASSLNVQEPHLASKCSSLGDIENRKPCNGEESPIGDSVSSDTRGVYYIKVLEEDLLLNVDDLNNV